MGGEKDKRVGASTNAAASDTAGQLGVGKTTLAGATPDPSAAEQAALDDPTKVPADYAKLDPELIQLMARSRATYWVFRDFPARKFWDSFRTLNVADLHTLVQVSIRAKAAGIWPLIQTIDQIYTYGTSWGIHFQATGLLGIATNGSWGKDFPQKLVRDEHEHTKHDWYRQNTGAGNSGLHLGLDAGEGHNNLHVDPTNPMERVGDGKLELQRNPMPWGPPWVPVLFPKGQAVYASAELIAHYLEIKNVIPAGHNADTNQTMLAIAKHHEAAATAQRYVQSEQDRASEVHDHGRATTAIAQVRTASATIDAIEAAAKPLAMQDDATSASQVAELATKLTAAKPPLWQALAAFVRHLHAEVPGYPPDLAGFDTEADWGPYAINDANKQISGLQARRAAK